MEDDWGSSEILVSCCEKKEMTNDETRMTNQIINSNVQNKQLWCEIWYLVLVVWNLFVICGLLFGISQPLLVIWDFPWCLFIWCLFTYVAFFLVLLPKYFLTKSAGGAGVISVTTNTVTNDTSNPKMIGSKFMIRYGRKKLSLAKMPPMYSDRWAANPASIPAIQPWLLARGQYSA
mgnify:CR=1 FL=1